jgi:hypothetical protein
MAGGRKHHYSGVSLVEKKNSGQNIPLGFFNYLFPPKYLSDAVSVSKILVGQANEGIKSE